MFTYEAATGEYWNATYGYLNQMAYTTSSSLNDMTSLSLYGFSALSTAQTFASNPTALMQLGQYMGSADVATQPNFIGPFPPQATPDSVASAALSFVGAAWNDEGCWVLANTISAEAGAGLPVQTSTIGTAGQANGEWMVAYNGPAGQSVNWESMVQAGDVVVIGNNSGLGHVTTCVSGSGATAMLVDNLIDATGGVSVSAHGAATADTVSSLSGLSLLAGAVSVSDTVEVRAYNGSYWGDWTSMAVTVSAPTASAPILAAPTAAQTWTQGSNVSFVLPAGTFTDPQGQVLTYAATLASGAALASWLAFNATSGTFSGTVPAGMASLSVKVTATDTSGLSTSETFAVTVPATAPKVTLLTGAQTWTQGSHVSFALPAGTFTDPQGQVLTYAATLASGAALPSWLAFNATSGTFSGTVPAGMASLSVKVTATDTSGLSTSETFVVTVPAAAPKVSIQMQALTCTEGTAVSLAIPTGLFSDPQGQALSYSMSMSSGAALPSGLTFSGTTLSGTAPHSSSPLSLKVTATDISGLSAFETLTMDLAAPAPVLHVQTAGQVWTAGKAFSRALPSNAFTDAQGQSLTFSATLGNGSALHSGLTFNAATGAFGGTAPLTGSTTWRSSTGERARFDGRDFNQRLLCGNRSPKASTSLSCAPRLAATRGRVSALAVYHRGASDARDRSNPRHGARVQSARLKAAQ